MSMSTAAPERAEEFFPTSKRGAWAEIAKFARSRPLGAACGVALILVFAIALLANVLAPYSPNENHSIDRLQSPSSTYLLGTDGFGRDVLSRILFGARISMQVAAISVAVSLTVSLVLGVSAAYFRGAWDFAVGRLIDVAQALPGIVLLIALLALFGRSVGAIGVVLGLAFGITGSRVIRGAAYAVSA